MKSMKSLESLATAIGKDIKDIKTRYATKEEMHEATEIDYSQIVTHEELEEKHYLTEHQNISHLATKAEVVTKLDKVDFDLLKRDAVTRSELDSKHYLTEHQSISHLATKEEVSKKLDDNVFKKVEQLLKDENKIDGSVWLWDKNMGSFNSNGWFKYRPISVDKGDKFFLLNIRGVFSYVVSKDGTRLLTKFSQSDSLVTTDYVASEDAILYITSQPNENAKVFNASLKELRNANVDFSNLPSDYISLKIPKLSLDIQPEELSFVEVVKQILDEKTFKAGKAWSGNGNGTYDADTWGTYPAVNLKAGITYGLKNIRGVFTHYFDKSGTKIFSFSSKDEIITRDFIPNVDGYILITRLITDKPSKIFQGGLGSARNLDNLEYGASAITPNVPFIIPETNTTQFGSNITGIDTTQQTTVNNLSYMSPIKKWEKSRGFIDTINVYVKQAGTYNFAIGNIDQNDLIVSPRIFQKQLSTGYNTLDVINEEHEIFYGEQLFFEAHDNTVYAARGERNLIQDAQHVTNNAGYSGKIMYGTDNAIPFNYKVADESTREKAEILKQKVDKIEPIVSGLELFKKMPMITSPNGTKFRLLVDNNGNLSTVSSVPNRVAIFGNSILSHPWLKGMGMAASAPDKDYLDRKSVV